MLQLTNKGDIRARVFGPTGSIFVIEPGETIEIGLDESELIVEEGGTVDVKPKKAKGKDSKKDGE
ncbi:hypothetical protein K7G91_000910 [Pasteurella canis]|uniref:hypothetical protein n=1 Tax=Pasteurella canis TaxID=753 RepID=UPI001D11B19C|nr:hypothetical protein [Pasteurella canis]UDW84623.1 hypothetical protein K7G91_000910 [Pasteurella canis]